jgi:hypothetical protein
MHFFFFCLDFDYVLGCAWLRIGGLGFHLLLSCDDLDPAMKFYWKSSQSVEKITSLKLEMQVSCYYILFDYPAMLQMSLLWCFVL